MKGKAHSQDFDGFTSSIFFNVDLKNLDTGLISYFQSRAELTLNKRPAWTSYPADVDIDSLFPFDTFSFVKHPYFLSDFKEGEMMVVTPKSGKSVGMTLSLSFASIEARNSIYKSIKKVYRKCSLKPVKRPNMAKPLEVTKFISKEGGDFVIITKGEGSSAPYINIAYNYQGYEW